MREEKTKLINLAKDLLKPDRLVLIGLFLFVIN